MKKEFVCGEDGFRVEGKNSQEVAGMGAWHVLMAHPEMKFSMKDMKDMVKDMKEM